MRQVLGPGALGRHRGIGWRGRWEGGSGCGIHVNPRLIHVNVWQKPLQHCKVTSLQLIKINGKKKNRWNPSTYNTFQSTTCPPLGVVVQSLSCVLLLGPHGLQPTRLLRAWDFPGKNTGVDCHCLLQGILLTHGSNPRFLHWRVDFLLRSHQRSLPCALSTIYFVALYMYLQEKNEKRCQCYFFFEDW